MACHREIYSLASGNQLCFLGKQWFSWGNQWFAIGTSMICYKEINGLS